MDLFLRITLGFIGFISSVAGLLMARKQRSNVARGRFFRLFVALAGLTLIITTWQSVDSYQTGQKAKEEAKKIQLGDAEHPPHIAIISLPNKTFFVRTNASEYPAYSVQMHLYSETDQTHPMRSYGPEEMAAHIAITDNDPWIINDNLEHRFRAEIVSRTGIAREELILRPAGNNQWMMACRIDGQISKCQQPDSAWPRDQNQEPTF
jgi:hypothetical protein